MDSALEYARRFKGAVQVDTPAVIDEVFASLSALEFQRDETEGGPPPPDPPRLVEYEKVALANLNPGTVAAAKSLVPSLERLLDSEVETALVVLRRASARGE